MLTQIDYIYVTGSRKVHPFPGPGPTLSFMSHQLQICRSHPDPGDHDTHGIAADTQHPKLTLAWVCDTAGSDSTGRLWGHVDCDNHVDCSGCETDYDGGVTNSVWRSA